MRIHARPECLEPNAFRITQLCLLEPALLLLISQIEQVTLVECCTAPNAQTQSERVRLDMSRQCALDTEDEIHRH